MPSATALTFEESRTEPSSPEVRQVRPPDIRSIWPVVAPFIEKAHQYCQGDESTPEHVLARVEAGLSQLWVVTKSGAIKAVIVHTVVATNTGQKLNVDILAGEDMTEWVDSTEALLLEFMSITGCQSIEALCRPGLARRLKRREWKQKAVLMELR